MESPLKTPIPVTVLTGFLGSGKTTLINRLLKERPDTRFGLIVNEFGDASLESQLIEARRNPLHELPSGCLCCVNEGDLKQALDTLLTKDARIDHVVVEASGLSSPGPLLGVLTQDGGRYTLSGVFCVADAVAFLKHEPEFPTVRRQLAFADAVLLTKTDLASSADRQQVNQRLQTLKPGVKVLDTAGRLPWTTLFDSTSERTVDADLPRAPRQRYFHGGRHHDAEVLEFRSTQPLDPDRLAEVFAHLDPGILRAKGVVYLADPSALRYKYLVQYTGSQKQLYSKPWAPGEVAATNLVFLGSAFDAAKLRSLLEGCTTGVTP